MFIFSDLVNCLFFFFERETDFLSFKIEQL